MERRKYPDAVAMLADEETALLTVWQAHTSVRCRCPDDGSCEARRALEDAISKIQDLLAREMGPIPELLRWVTGMAVARPLGVDRAVDRYRWNSQCRVCTPGTRAGHRC